MGNTLRNLAIAGGLLAGSATLYSCAPESLREVGTYGGAVDTYGPGSVLSEEKGCDPITTTITLDTNGDRVAYAVDDLSVDNGVFRTAEQNVEDELLVTAVGRVGNQEVTEVVFENGRYHDGVIEVLSGLPFDQTLKAGEEYRVDLEDLRANPDEDRRQVVFEIREAELKTEVTVRPVGMDPADGATVTFAQDCTQYAPVAQ